MSAAATSWRAQPERGSRTGLELLVLMTDLLGRDFVGLILWPVCVYFALFATAARRASEAYLARMKITPSFANVVRHLHAFGWVAADRYLFLAGDLREFELHHHGHEHMLSLAESPNGALLLGSHVGSFEAMRTLALRHDFSLSIVADFGNAARINGVFAQLHPQLKLDLIEMDPNNSLWMLEVKERTEAGGMVAMLADRVDDEPDAGRIPRAVTVDFLGGRAAFPTGPFVLAHTLQCPVVLALALFDGGRRYDLHCEPLAERVELPRNDRARALQELVQRYADRLAAHVTSAPFNWFNFYDFWKPQEALGSSTAHE